MDNQKVISNNEAGMTAADSRKVVIELQNVKRNFLVGDEWYMLCAASRSRFSRASLSPSWERLVLESQRFSISWAVWIRPPQENICSTVCRFAR